MKTSKEGEWTVTTPIICGQRVEIEIASRCNHATFQEVSSAVLESRFVIHEKCLNCVASRIRYRTATIQELTGRP